MPTLKEVITDVLANPAKYADAFPVTEPVPPHVARFWGDNARRMIDLTSVPTEFGGGLPRTATEVMIREQNERMSRRLNEVVWGDGSYQSILDNGEPLYHNSLCHYCNQSRACVSRRVDTLEQGSATYGLVCLECANITATGLQAFLTEREIYRRAQEQYPTRLGPVLGFDYSTATGAMIRAEQERASRQHNEPRHYRVRGGLCACGFESAFTGDMDRHIEVGPYPPPRGPLHDQVIFDEAVPPDTAWLIAQGRVANTVSNLGEGEDPPGD